MVLYIIQELLNTKVIYYKSGLIIWRKEVVEDDIMIIVKMIYIVGIGQYITSDEQYKLSKNITLKTLISSYRKIIDEFNLISKK